MASGIVGQRGALAARRSEAGDQPEIEDVAARRLLVRAGTGELPYYSAQRERDAERARAAWPLIDAAWSALDALLALDEQDGAVEAEHGVPGSPEVDARSPGCRDGEVAAAGAAAGEG